MAEIVYKPHCSECGFPIDTSKTEVAYQKIYKRVSKMELPHVVGAIINPDKCTHCGASFDNIVIVPPKKLQDIYADW